MASGYPFWTEDTMAAAALAGTGAAAFQSKLDALSVRLNIPALYALVEWWPLLLIITGLILVLVHPQSQGQPARRKTRNPDPGTEISHES